MSWRLWGAVGGLFLAGFVATAVLASRHPHLEADLWVSHRLQELEAAPLERALALASALVEFPWSALLLMGVLALLAMRRRWPEAALFLGAQALRPLNILVKEAVGRPRPSPLLVEVQEFPSTPSFPSGHVLSSLLFFGLLFLWARHLAPSPWQWVLRLLCLWVMAFTAMERIHTGAHWFSDVYGALLLAVPWLVLVCALGRWARRPL